MNPRAKQFVAQSFSASGLFSLMESLLKRNGCPAFMLHRVLPVEETDDCYNPNLAITPESLDSFITFLKKRFTLVSVAELLEACLRGQAKKVCALTFDDGWEDNYRVALPVLRSHSAPAMIFLPSEMIGSTELLPEERLCRTLTGPKKSQVQQLLWEKLSPAGLTQQWRGISDFERMQLFFKQLDYSGKIAFLNDAERISGFSKPVKSSFITWEQAREMSKSQITFGSHTRRHTILSVNPVDFMRFELADSKKKIEQELGARVDYFAYPNGMHSAEAVQEVKAAGYTGAFSTARAVINRDSDRFLLPRVPLSNDMVNAPGGRFAVPMAQLLLVKTYMFPGDASGY